MNQVMNRRWSGRAAACVGLLATAAAVHGQGHVFHVDDDAPPGGDGMSWATAFRDLQDALESGRATGSRIHIAQGIYKPDRGTGNRTATFTLLSGVKLLGGFAGIGAADPDEKDPRRFISVLSGDLAGDDLPGFVNRGDNAFHVVTVGANSNYTLLSGLTVWGGAATGTGANANGAGVFAPTDGLQMDNCIITECIAHGDGGAVFAGGGYSLIRGSRLVRNSAVGSGGAAWLGAWSVTTRTVVLENQAGVDGGGIYFRGLGARNIDTSLIAGNVAGRNGGGIATGSVSSSDAYAAIFDGCTLVGNVAYAGGGIWWGDSRRLGLWHSILWDNQAEDPSTAQAATDPEFGLQIFPGNSNVQGGMLMPSGGDYFNGNIDEPPLFVDANGADNDPGTFDDNDYRLTAASPCLDFADFRPPGDISSEIPADLDGRPRDVSAVCNSMALRDMGAYEFAPNSCSASARVYVRQDAPQGGDGLTWDAAFSTIEEALSTPGVQEVWIARGMYTPAVEWRIGLHLSRDMALYGGFAGVESSIDERSIAENPTVISGDRLGNDDQPDGRLDNTQWLLIAEGVAITLDGLVFEAGQAAWQGGVGSPVSLRMCSAVIRNCQFRLNEGDSGGAIALFRSDAEFDNCEFTANTALGFWMGGGAVLARDSMVVFRQCGFGYNTHRAIWAVGGALFTSNGSLRVEQCMFVGNSADAIHHETNYAAGGAIQAGGPTVVTSSVFRRNLARALPTLGSIDAFATGGAISSVSEIDVVSTEFLANRVDGRLVEGAAISGWGLNLHLCTVVGNHATGASGWQDTPAAAISGQSAQVHSSILTGNRWNEAESELTQLTPFGLVSSSIVAGWTGQAMSGDAVDIEPGFIDPIGPDGEPGTGDEILALRANSLAIDAAAALIIDPNDPQHDAAGLPRVHDDLGMPNIGIGAGGAMDIGAYEFQGTSCRADHDGDGVIDDADIIAYLVDWFAERAEADFDRDREHEVADIYGFLTVWFARCP